MMSSPCRLCVPYLMGSANGIENNPLPAKELTAVILMSWVTEGL